MNEAWKASVYGKPSLETDWEEARRFHGHLGPWLALGMKMGEEALRLLEARPHFGVTVRIGCHLAPPVSCLIDGLQWMTGATYGKRNLLAAETDAVCVQVTRDETGQSVRFTLRPDVPEAIGRWLAEMGDESASRHLYAMPASELFEIFRDMPAVAGPSS